MTADQPQGQTPQGVFAQPGLLAAGAAGCLAATLMLWALRGLPLGTAVMWIVPFPLFAAGFGFGPASTIAGALLATLLVAAAGTGIAAAAFLALFAVPAVLLVMAAMPAPGGPMRLGLPMALLGLWPVAVLLGASLFLADDGGLEAAMRRATETALARLGVPAADMAIEQLVRIKAAAIGFWAALALLLNAAAAIGFLAKRRLLAVPRPDWATARLPRWYPALPPVAALGFLAAPEGEDAVALSAFLLLLVPLFLQGIAGVHARLRGRKARLPLLAAFYVLLVLFLQVMGPGLVGLGLYDQFQRRATPRQS